MITVEELIAAIERKNNYPFDQEQKDAIVHTGGPLWIIAGPGTGKTEVLVLKVLRLLCCDGIDPQSIIVTTFTEKAALNLENRIASGMLYLSTVYPELAGVTYCQLRIGTIHSLCSDIMQEYRYAPFQNVRLMDDVEQTMFILQNVSKYVRDHYNRIKDFFFPILVTDGRLVHSNRLWVWTRVLTTLFDHIVEDNLDLSKMKQAGGHWLDLANAFDYYESQLAAQHSCDFAHLQKYFYEFLQTAQGNDFLLGTGQVSSSPISAVLIDEYQDTNPVQERIYFMLAQNDPHNICVVGDDDQALYRFRGGTVDCMINFASRCNNIFGIIPTTIQLSTNHRSNKKIVDWCNTYIESFNIMSQPGARAPKPALRAVPSNPGFDAAVGLIRGNNNSTVANSLADTILSIKAHNIIEDYSQCVLILPSTKDSSRAAGPFLEALSRKGIPVYNPRAKDFLDHDEVKEFLGAFISIIDPELSGISQTYYPEIYGLVSSWLNSYQSVAQAHPQLQDYISRSSSTIQANTVPGVHFAKYSAGILYRILSFEPFINYQSAPERDLRLSKITRIFESFISLNGRALTADNLTPSHVNNWWLSRFYTSMCGYLSEYGMDDDEEDDVICPRGFLPIMTIHQSKGLEFDFVFAGNLGRSVSPDSAHRLEEQMSPFKIVPATTNHTLEELAWQDSIRKHYVTYSRAKHALVLLASTNQLRKAGTETASFSQHGGAWFRNNYRPI